MGSARTDAMSPAQHQRPHRAGSGGLGLPVALLAPGHRVGGCAASTVLALPPSAKDESRGTRCLLSQRSAMPHQPEGPDDIPHPAVLEALPCRAGIGADDRYAGTGRPDLERHRRRPDLRGGQGVSLTLPSVTGTGACTNVKEYHLHGWYGSSSLPSGLSWDSATRTISGTPSAVFAEKRFRYSGDDLYCYEIVYQFFNITVVDGPTLQESAVQATTATLSMIAHTGDWGAAGEPWFRPALKMGRAKLCN